MNYRTAGGFWNNLTTRLVLGLKMRGREIASHGLRYAIC